MASSKAGNKERKLRREAGVTQGGAARGGKAKQPKRVRAARNAVGGENFENSPEAKLLSGGTVRQLTEEPLPSSDISPSMGRSPDASTGLSDTANTGTVVAGLSSVLESSGAAFDNAASIARDDERGQVVLDAKGNPIQQYASTSLLSSLPPASTKNGLRVPVLPAAERQRRNELEAASTSRRQTKIAKAAKDMPVTSREAAAAQGKRLEDVDLSTKGLEKAQVTGKPAIKQPKVVTADPRQTGVRFQKDKQGKIRSTLIPRGNPVKPKPVSRVDTSVRMRGAEAAKVLVAAEGAQKLDSYRSGLTRRERAERGLQDDERLSSVVDVERTEERRREQEATAGQYVDQGSAIGGQIVHTETPVEPVMRPVTRAEALANSNNPLTQQERGQFRGLQSAAARSGAVTKINPNTVGSSAISDQFRRNVQSWGEAADPERIKAGETGVIDDEGNITYTDTNGNVVHREGVPTYGGMTLREASDNPVQFNKILGRVRKNKRSTEIDPFSRKGNTERSISSVTEDMEADIDTLGDGGTPSERAAAFIAAAPNSVKAAERSALVFTGSGGALATGSTAKPTETNIMRTYKDATGLESTRSLREEVQDNWAPYRDKLKAIAEATGRPLESLTVDDAIRHFGIQEGTRRDTTNEMESFPGKRAGQSALRFRKNVVDPATGKSVSGRAVNAAVANMRVNTQGAAAPTDDELAKMRARQPRLANILSRLPGSAGVTVASVVNPHQLGWHGPIHPDDQARIDAAYARGTQPVNIGGREVEAGIGTITAPKTDAVRAYPLSERGETPDTVKADVTTPSGTISRRVGVNAIPEVKGETSAGARLDRDYVKDTMVNAEVNPENKPWVNEAGRHMGTYGPVYAPTQAVLSATEKVVAPTITPAVVAGRNTTSFTGSGAYFDPTAVPATSQNIQRAAARPTRRAGIAAAKSVAETRRREASPMPAPAPVTSAPTMLPDEHPLRVQALAEIEQRKNADKAREEAASLARQNDPAVMARIPRRESTAPIAMGGSGQPFSPEGPTGPAVTTNSTDIAQRMGTMPLPSIRSPKNAVLPRSVTSNDPRIGIIVQPTGYIHPALTRDAVGRGANSGTTESRPAQLIPNWHTASDDLIYKSIGDITAAGTNFVQPDATAQPINADSRRVAERRFGPMATETGEQAQTRINQRTPPPPPAMSFGTPVRRRRGSQP